MKVDAPYVAALGAALSANKGAASMLLALVDHVDRIVPGGRVISLSTYPESDAAENHSDRLEIVDYRPLPMVLIHLPLALLSGLTRVFGGTGALFARTRALRTLREAEVVADLAGISFSDGRGFPTLVYNTLMTGIPLLLGARVVKCAQAIGSLERVDTKLAATLVLPRLRGIVARGKGTLDHLIEFGILDVVEGYDMAFLLEIRQKHQQESMDVLPEMSDPFFVVSASSVVEELCDRHGIDYVGLMVDLIERLVDETELHAVLIAHSARPGRPKGRMNDLPVIEEIGRRIDSRSVHTIAEGLDPRVLRAIISRGEFLLTSRFHAMISGLATATPTVVVGWSHKYREVMIEFGLEDFVVSFEDFQVETLLELSLRAARDRASLASRIDKTLPSVRRRAEVNLSALEKATAHE